MPIVPYQNLFGVDPGCPINWAHSLNNGRVAWWLSLPNWTGGGKWRDLVRQQHNGTLTSMLGVSGNGWKPPLQKGGFQSLLFDGVAGRVSCPNDTAVSTNNTSTLALWMQPISSPSSRCNAAYVNKSGLYALQLAWHSANSGLAHLSAIKCEVYTSGSAVDTKMSPANAVLVNTAHRVVMTWTQTPTITLYIDGKSVAVTSDSAYDYASDGYYFGARDDGTDPFPGYLDDISLWSRQLSAAEVAEDYLLSQRGYPGVLNRPSPVRFFLVSGAATANYMRLPLLGCG